MTDDSPTTTEPATKALDVVEVMTRTIDALVMAVADQMDPNDPLRVEAELYQMIADVYANKAQIARAFAKKPEN